MVPACQLAKRHKSPKHCLNTVVLARSFSVLYTVYLLLAAVSHRLFVFSIYTRAHTHNTHAVIIFSGDATFGCPQTRKYYPEEDFSCQEKIYTALLTQASSQTHQSCSPYQHYIVCGELPPIYILISADSTVLSREQI